MANGLWIASGESLLEDFLSQCKKYYGARVQATLFPQPALDEVNQFVKEETRGRIPKILERLDPRDVVVLVNAISFKGAWTTPFPERETQEEPFFVHPRQPVRASMMKVRGAFTYGTTPGLEYVWLPYRSGMKMVVILPQPGVALNKILANGALLQQAFSKGDFRAGQVRIPKWKLNFTWDIVKFMKDEGITTPLDAKVADFSGILAKPEVLTVSQAIQKTFIAVDEKGTEAAAATAISMTKSAGGAPREPKDPFDFHANRPFVYAIVDHNSVPFFFGVVSNPRGQ